MLKEKKLFKRDNNGLYKQFKSVSLIDLFISPDNDLLDERSGAKALMEALLNSEKRTARRLSYFQCSPSLLIFLKVNFNDELGSFDSTIADDDGFKLFSGFDKGPCDKELLVNGAPTKSSLGVKASPSQFAMGSAPMDNRRGYSPVQKA